MINSNYQFHNEYEAMFSKSKNMTNDIKNWSTDCFERENEQDDLDNIIENELNNENHQALYDINNNENKITYDELIYDAEPSSNYIQSINNKKAIIDKEAFDTVTTIKVNTADAIQLKPKVDVHIEVKVFNKCEYILFCIYLTLLYNFKWGRLLFISYLVSLNYRPHKLNQEVSISILGYILLIGNPPNVCLVIMILLMATPQVFRWKEYRSFYAFMRNYRIIAGPLYGLVLTWIVMFSGNLWHLLALILFNIGVYYRPGKEDKYVNMKTHGVFMTCSFCLLVIGIGFDFMKYYSFN
jgi:hypothetical protein